jgi:hypothetical protein
MAEQTAVEVHPRFDKHADYLCSRLGQNMTDITSHRMSVASHNAKPLEGIFYDINQEFEIPYQRTSRHQRSPIDTGTAIRIAFQVTHEQPVTIDDCRIALGDTSTYDAISMPDEPSEVAEVIKDPSESIIIVAPGYEGQRTLLLHYAFRDGVLAKAEAFTQQSPLSQPVPHDYNVALIAATGNNGGGVFVGGHYFGESRHWPEQIGEITIETVIDQIAKELIPRIKQRFLTYNRLCDNNYDESLSIM